MYAGHVALALLAKSARPKVPLALLVPIAFAPDWTQWMIESLGHENAEYSHSLVAIGIGASIVGLGYWAWTRSPGDALALSLTYVSHWPADFITATKPTWPGGPDVGLMLYAHPVADVLLESLVIALCWFAYQRSLPAPSRRRAIGLLVPLGLIGMQIGFAAIQNPAVKDPLRGFAERVYP